VHPDEGDSDETKQQHETGKAVVQPSNLWWERGGVEARYVVRLRDMLMRWNLLIAAPFHCISRNLP
jgi:hypothetical protein